MLLLAGDIGGTTARFQIVDTEDENRGGEMFSYPSGDFPDFYALLHQLLCDKKIQEVDVACFGLPGPITDQQVELTNLPWRISVQELKRQLPVKKIRLINDFYAAALGIDLLAEQDRCCLYAGNFDPDGNRLVIGAGTGLGVAPVYQLGGRFYPQASEGGHMDFAPLNQEQEALLKWLHSRWNHVSYENILSGSGLETLYRFCLERNKPIAYVTEVTARVRAPEVHRLARAGDMVAVDAIRLFVNIYGEFVGNAALLWPARAGIYIAGGIGAKIADWMKSREFVSYFLNKGTMRPLVETMPVYLVMDEMIGLKGAMLMAQRLVSEEQI
ncbi:MAG: glucokinase [Desulfuromonadaceae bacterium]|nr:glucokinase [Desulfuromonas sp.]MDY0184525.1 glucokinase [Desulfuromonadaceae bacterium]